MLSCDTLAMILAFSRKKVMISKREGQLRRVALREERMSKRRGRMKFKSQVHFMGP